MLKAERELELVSLAQAGDQKAMKALIDAHMPLIRKIARSGKEEHAEDLESQLVMAFIEHLPKFDTDRGFRVNTYMRWWLRQTAVDYNHKNFDIVTTPNAGPMARIVSKVKRAKRDLHLTDENSLEGRKAIAEKAGVSLEDLAFAEAWGTPRIARLDAPISADNDDAADVHMELTADSIDLVAKLTLDQRRAAIALGIGTLNPREQDILRRRWLMSDGVEEETLEEVGAIYGITRERVRQIESKAMDKLVRIIRFQSSHLLEPGHQAEAPRRHSVG